MKTRKLSVQLLGAIAVLCSIACDVDVAGPEIKPGPGGIDIDPKPFQATAEFAYQVPLVGQEVVRLKGWNGAIRFEGSPLSSEVKITGTKRVRASTLEEAEAGLLRLQVAVLDGSGEVGIRSEHPQKDDREYEVDYTVSLPAGMTVFIENTNGQITLDGMAGHVDAELVNGPIRASVTLPEAGFLDLFTINGDINVDFQREASATFQATLTHGKITATNLPLQGTVETPRSLTGQLGGGAGMIRLALVNGDISAVGR